MYNFNHTERLNGNLEFVNGSMADLETKFLTGRLLTLETYLEHALPDWAERAENWTPLSWCRCFQLEPCRCEVETLAKLLHHPRRQQLHLEEMLGDRLLQLEQGLAQTSFTHTYDDSFWQLETERLVITKILNDWWHWLRTVPA